MKGRLFGVGVGPGDPELMTYKAVRIIKECQVLAVPARGRKHAVSYRIAAEMIENMEEKEPTLQDTINKNVEALWKKFQSVPVDRNGNLKAAWYAFPKGTNKNDVYDWFNRHYSKGLSYLMEEVKKE